MEEIKCDWCGVKHYKIHDCSNCSNIEFEIMRNLKQAQDNREESIIISSVVVVVFSVTSFIFQNHIILLIGLIIATFYIIAFLVFAEQSMYWSQKVVENKNKNIPPSNLNIKKNTMGKPPRIFRLLFWTLLFILLSRIVFNVESIFIYLLGLIK